MYNRPGVEEVDYDLLWIERLTAIIDMLRALGFFIGGALVLASVFTIFNVIKLTVYGRQEEIGIMRLVGATDGFIKRPFYVEGMVQGLISGVVSYGILFVSYKWLHHVLPNLDAYIYMFTLPSRFVFLNQWGTLLIIPFGGLMGLLGSYIAVRRVF